MQWLQKYITGCVRLSFLMYKNTMKLIITIFFFLKIGLAAMFIMWACYLSVQNLL